MSDERQFIERDLHRIKETYDLEKEHLFAIWVLANFHFQGDLSESTLDEVYQKSYALLEEGAAGDDCLDGYFYQDDTSTLYLYQVKWPATADKKTGVGDAREVANALTILSNQTGLENIGEARAGVITAFNQVMQEEGQIVLRGVSGGKWTPTHDDAIRKLIPKELSRCVEVELYGLSEIKHFLAEQTSDLSGKNVELKLFESTSDPILEHPKTNVPGMGDALVTLVSALSLADVAATHGERLFERNVRLYLGRGRINKRMQDTIQNDPDTFWFGHNGITLLCDGFDRVGDHDRPNSLNIENPQIVNGCQTASTLKEVYGTPEKRRGAKDFAVLTKIIRLQGDKEARAGAAELVAFRTNNQSSVNEADMCANDRQQVHFQNILSNYGAPWFYERKRGEWKNLPKPTKQKYRKKKSSERTIDRDTYQQAWRSYALGRPSDAIQKKNAVWERRYSNEGKDLYDQVFSMERRECDIILPVVLMDWFAKVFTVTRDGTSLCFDIRKELKQYSKLIPRAKALIAVHSTALFGQLVKDVHDGDVTSLTADRAAEIISQLDRGTWIKKNWSCTTKTKSWKVIDEAVERILQTWHCYFQSIKSTNESIYVTLKQKEERAFEDLKGYLSTMIKDDDHRREMVYGK